MAILCVAVLDQQGPNDPICAGGFLSPDEMACPEDIMRGDDVSMKEQLEALGGVDIGLSKMLTQSVARVGNNPKAMLWVVDGCIRGMIEGQAQHISEIRLVGLPNKGQDFGGIPIVEGDPLDWRVQVALRYVKSERDQSVAAWPAVQVEVARLLAEQAAARARLDSGDEPQ